MLKQLPKHERNMKSHNRMPKIARMSSSGYMRESLLNDTRNSERLANSSKTTPSGFWINSSNGSTILRKMHSFVREMVLYFRTGANIVVGGVGKSFIRSRLLITSAHFQVAASSRSYQEFPVLALHTSISIAKIKVRQRMTLSKCSSGSSLSSAKNCQHLSRRCLPIVRNVQGVIGLAEMNS